MSEYRGIHIIDMREKLDDARIAVEKVAKDKMEVSVVCCGSSVFDGGSVMHIPALKCKKCGKVYVECQECGKWVTNDKFSQYSCNDCQ